MENKNKILMGLGAIAAVFLGKKLYDRRSGSGAMYLFGVPTSGNYGSDEEAFFAFMQRKDTDDKASATGRYDSLQSRKLWMRNMAPGAYSAAQFEEGGLYSKGGKAEQAFYQWQSQWADGMGVGNQGSWSADGGSDQFGGDFTLTNSQASKYSEGDSSWSASGSSDPFSGFGFPNVDAPRFK